MRSPVRIRRSALAAVLALSLTAAVVSACSGRADGRSADGPIAVVAGENFWGDVAAAVGGRHVTVRSIIAAPNQDPHEYEATAADAGAVARARLVIQNGYGYDDFLTTLLRSDPASGRAHVLVQKVLGGSSDDNPHVWYDTARLPLVAAAVAEALSRLQPAHQAEFTANAQRFDASLAPITAVIADIRAHHAGARIAYTERVPQYLTDAAGLVPGMPAGFARAVEQGEDPSPADTAEFESSIAQRRVAVLLLNTQVVDTETRRIAALAAAHHVPVVDVTETVPPGQDFVAWQLAQARALLSALNA